MAQKKKKGDPLWFRYWKMVVGVVGGTGIICGGLIVARTYIEYAVTVDVRARLEVIEVQIDGLIKSVGNIETAVASNTDKEYETDKAMIRMVIEAYDAKHSLARNP